MDRTSYYRPATILKERDKADVVKLLAAHQEHAFYGVQRLSWELGWGQNKTRRIRNLAGIKIAIPSKKRKYNTEVASEITAPANALKKYAVFKDEDRPQDGMDYSQMVNARAWVQDFTHIWFNGCWHYLAVVMDLKTRQVVGWCVGVRHTSELTYHALLDGLSKHDPPNILHSDQGSEYLSHKHRLICERMEIILSCSSKGSPWQNGFMERFFGSFKHELPDLKQLNDVAQLHEAVAIQMHYYNTKRLHTALKTTPLNYAKQLKEQEEREETEKLEKTNESQGSRPLDRVLRETGG